MSILRELRVKADEKKLHQELKESHDLHLDNAYKQAILPKMQEIFSYLNEIVKHLNFVADPIVIKDYTRRYAQMGDLLQHNYRINTDGYGGLADFNRLMQINLTCSLSGEGFFSYDVEGKRIIEQEISFLHSRNMPFDWKNVSGHAGIKTATFTMMRKIPVRFRFEVRYDAAQLQLIIDNHEDFTTHTKMLAPEEVTESFLEDMLSYLLRRNQSFARQEIPEDYRQKLRDDLQAAERERAALIEQIRQEQLSNLQKKNK
jgi:hypothetical protein